MMTGPRIAYVTDLEGQWSRLEGFAARTPGVRLGGDQLLLDDDLTFVFGGDAIDRGPDSRRIVRTLLDAHRRYGPRAVLLAGNRDLNKLRLARELRGHPPPRLAHLADDRVALLQAIFRETMGAPEAFEHRAGELRREGLPDHPAAVVDSFLDDLGPGGELLELMRASRLAHRQGGTLFLHGGLSPLSLGLVPGEERIDGLLDQWVDRLNAFAGRQLDAFAEQARSGQTASDWAPLVAYQAPAPGLGSNPASVVYGRLADAWTNPHLPHPDVVQRLRSASIRRLVLGHTPQGDFPAILRTDGFELVVADTSRGRVSGGPGLWMTDQSLHVRAEVMLDDGTRHDLAADIDVDSEPGPLGLRVTDGGGLVKARGPGGTRLVTRVHSGHRLSQRLLTAEILGELETPW